MPHQVTLIDAWGVSELANRVGDVLRPGGLGAALRVDDGSYLQVSLLDTDDGWVIDSMWDGDDIVHKHGFGKRTNCRLWPLREDIAEALDEACIRRGLMEGGDSRHHDAP